MGMEGFEIGNGVKRVKREFELGELTLSADDIYAAINPVSGMLISDKQAHEMIACQLNKVLAERLGSFEVRIAKTCFKCKIASFGHGKSEFVKKDWVCLECQ